MTELQLIDKKTRAKLEKLSAEQRVAILAWYSWETTNLDNVPIDVAEWERITTAITTDSVVSAVSAGLGEVYAIASVSGTSEYFLNLKTDGFTLSERLRDSADAMQKITAETIREHLNHKTTWKRLTDDLTRKNVSRGDLPKYLRELRKEAIATGGDTAKLNRLIASAESRIAELAQNKAPTKELQKAYSKVVDAVRSGNESAFNTALKSALDQKAVYNNARIARTETARAYASAYERRVQAHPLYKKDRVAIRWVLSSRHAVPDVCDIHAGSDSYGLGAGVYPAKDAPAIPAHPHCGCGYSTVIIPEGITPKYDESAVDKTVDTFTGSDKKRVEYSVKNNPPRKLSALPKELVR